MTGILNIYLLGLEANLWPDWRQWEAAPASSTSASGALREKQSVWSPSGTGCRGAKQSPGLHLITKTSQTEPGTDRTNGCKLRFLLTQSYGGNGEENKQVPPEESFEALLADGAEPLLHDAGSPLHGSVQAPPQVTLVRQLGFVGVLV